MNCLLCSRTELGILAERDSYIQDVDVYLEQLLATFADPDVFDRTRRYLSKYDGEVFKRLRRSELGHVRYRILRTSSDFLLVSACTFATPPLRRGRSKQEPIEEGYIGRGKTYYHFAYSYSQRLHRPNTVITEVLEKLSLGFDRYARILAHMRGEAKEDLLARLCHGEVFVLERMVDCELEETLFEEKQDHLLEAISEFHRTRTSESRDRVAELATDMEAMRPEFHYDLARLDTPAFSLLAGPSIDAPPPSGPDGLGPELDLPGIPRTEQETPTKGAAKDSARTNQDAPGSKRDKKRKTPTERESAREAMLDVPETDGTSARPPRQKSQRRRKPPEASR
jgi:hypothetical protein